MADFQRTVANSDINRYTYLLGDLSPILCENAQPVIASAVMRICNTIESEIRNAKGSNTSGTVDKLSQFPIRYFRAHQVADGNRIINLGLSPVRRVQKIRRFYQ